MAELEDIYECPKCYVIIPYLGCFHSCPGVKRENTDEEGFQEDLSDWYIEIKNKMKEGTVRVVEAPEPKVVVHLLPNLPGQEYQEDIQGPGLDGSYHLRRVGEQVPEGVVPKRYIETAPGEYRPEDEVLAEGNALAEELWRMKLRKNKIRRNIDRSGKYSRN